MTIFILFPIGFYPFNHLVLIVNIMEIFDLIKNSFAHIIAFLLALAAPD